MPRCDNNEIENLEHMLWVCPDNKQNGDILFKLKSIWGSLPQQIDNEIKPNEIPNTISNFITLATKWILNDKTHGTIQNIVGSTIKKIYNIRPEIKIYNSMVERNNTTQTKNTKTTNNDNKNQQNMQTEVMPNQPFPKNREGIT